MNYYLPNIYRETYNKMIIKNLMKNVSQVFLHFTDYGKSCLELRRVIFD